jgi:hypothetical protein
VIELRFHEELYDGYAIDEAAKVYAAFGKIELSREPLGFVVRIAATPEALSRGIDEVTLAAELGNYALGKTIERSRVAAVGGAS